jgi:hypothetical protein
MHETRPCIARRHSPLAPSRTPCAVGRGLSFGQRLQPNQQIVMKKAALVAFFSFDRNVDSNQAFAIRFKKKRRIERRTWTGTPWRDIANGEMVDNKRRSSQVWPAARHCLTFPVKP